MKFLWSLLALLSFSTNSQTIVIAYSNDAFPPYIVGTGTVPDKDRPGVTIETLTHIAEHLGLEVVFKRAPWSRVLSMAKNNRVDAVFHASYKAERAVYLAYPMVGEQPDKAKYLKRQRYFLYRRKGTHVYNHEGDIHDLQGAIGTVTRYAVVDSLRYQGLDVREVSDARKGLELLSKGRLGGWVGLESINDELLSTTPFFGNVEKVALPVLDQSSYLAFTKTFYEKNEPLAQLFWAHVEGFTGSPEYLHLMKKYRVQGKLE
ncbi:hypothetical protein IX95_22135 [Vibrio sp. B183]|uniref:substrate-binding periplasmic protein n=1 Tax=Vibrio sp. B183 TaxID=1526762 RepID=UPI000501653A|nr:transporter substrate-binding domain-containing protein [Vibrio sp. B183]KFI09861.1 hypothetical protein IX95_22135 [Vibrio sp. B183]